MFFLVTASDDVRREPSPSTRQDTLLDLPSKLGKDFSLYNSTSKASIEMVRDECTGKRGAQALTQVLVLT